MNEQSYPFTLSRTEYRYEFVSISAEKEVIKIVMFTKTATDNVYNLALLDLLSNGKLSDTAETNNNDMATVLATVFQVVVTFLNLVPDCFVVFSGSDDRRQRLYRILISRELEEISKKFEVFGAIGETILTFEKNIIYDFYLIKKL